MSLNGIITAPIARKEGSIIERCINNNGTCAISHYEILEVKNGLSLTKFVLETGRTHQIRVHSKYIDCSILGDTLYGKSSTLIDRQALHCYRVSFIHPITKNKLCITCSLPRDMSNIFKDTK